MGRLTEIVDEELKEDQDFFTDGHSDRRTNLKYNDSRLNDAVNSLGESRIVLLVEHVVKVHVDLEVFKSLDQDWNGLSVFAEVNSFYSVFDCLGYIFVDFGNEALVLTIKVLVVNDQEVVDVVADL